MQTGTWRGCEVTVNGRCHSGGVTGSGSDDSHRFNRLNLMREGQQRACRLGEAGSEGART